MSMITVFMIALGLSMDACAVSFAKGITLRKNVIRYGVIFGIAFGGFQGLMPLIGWWAGTYFENLITSVDHWIAFILLGIIGINMIRESREGKDSGEKSGVTEWISGREILVMAVATSIDALAVGISFAFLQVSIVPAVCLIGITTFVMSFAAAVLGNKVGGKLGKYAELTGGIILILIGTKILIEHLTGM